jgi:hypothetical protein
MNTDEEQLDKEKKKFLLKHWKMTIVMAASIIGAAIIALYVFLWVVSEAILLGPYPVGLGDWTIGLIVMFVLNLIYWELLLVATWVIPLVGGLYWWVSKLPDAEIWKPKRGRRESGDAFGFFIAMAWLIMIWIDGRWNQTLQTWTFTEWIYSWLTALGWLLLIAGIPAIILIVLWFVFGEKMKETISSIETADEVADESSE